jgi:hypothetical protein
MLRETLSVLLPGATAASPFAVASGVRQGTSTTTVTTTSTTWTMGLHAGVLNLESAVESGPYCYAVNTAQTGSVNAAHATLPRVDIVWVRLDDPAEGDGSSVPAVVAGYTAGTANASPVAPATPARCMVLAQLNVPASGGGAPTAVWKAPQIGELPVCRLTTSAVTTTSGTPATFGSVAFNAETYDPLNLHDNATNNSRITVATSGYYHLGGKLRTGTGTSLAARFAVNGASLTETEAWAGFAAGAFADISIDTTVFLTAGQYVELQGATSSASVALSAASCFFELQFLRP